MSYNYIGCYKDTGNRALPNFFPNISDPNVCKNKALSLGHNIYAMQYGNQCFTGTNLQQATQYGQYPNSVGPFGNIAQVFCGTQAMPWTNKLYYANPSTMPSTNLSPNELACYQSNYPDLSGLNPDQLQNHWNTIGKSQNRNSQCPGTQTVSGNYNYIGCYNDTGNRAIPNWRNNGVYVKSVDECRTLAEQNRDTIFGVQNGGACFTGNDLTKATQYGQNFNGQQCGGSMGAAWTNKVYVRGQPFPPPVPPIPVLGRQNFNEANN